MGSLRLTIVLTVGLTLLLPPRWCCALPAGMGPCGVSCRSTPGKSCCACSQNGKSEQRPSGPCKCACEGSIDKVDKSPVSPEIALPTFCVPAIDLAVSLDSQATALVPCELLPPLDVQTMLRRWRC